MNGSRVEIYSDWDAWRHLPPERAGEVARNLEGSTYSVVQLRFIDLIIQHLTDNGVMPASRLYESPFTDHAP